MSDKEHDGPDMQIPCAEDMHEAFDAGLAELGESDAESAIDAINMMAVCAATEALIGIKYELEKLNRKLDEAVMRWRSGNVRH
ncbi:MAG TPA: hypothetical protein VFI02_20660 [Armatimonadota bacterium]|nr:hypothetical protein [Armatimonadota bacterium]